MDLLIINDISSNSKNTLSFSSSQFSSSSSDKKIMKILSNIKNKIKDSNLFHLSQSKINEIEEIIILKIINLILWIKKNRKNFIREKTILNSNSSLQNNKEKNPTNITKTTSINSRSINSNNNNISSFRMSISNLKNSNLSINFKDNCNILTTLNLKNAIANVELNNSEK